MREKNMKNRWIACLLAGVMLLTGCGKQTTEHVPELLDVAATNDAYRPVERGNIGDVGNLEVLKGVVVPQEDCYFFEASATIEDVKVTVGDYVEAGTVLATIHLDEIKKDIANLTESLKQERESYNQQKKINELVLEKYDYQKKALEETGDKDGAADLKKQRDIEKENQKFEGLMHQRQIRQYETELAEKRKLLGQGELVARHAGYVTFVKDLAKNADAAVSENIVIVADYSKKYIEVRGENGSLKMDDKDHSMAESVYTTVGGKRYALSLYEYSKNILAMMQANTQYANIRYEVPAEVPAEIGDFLPVCYAKKTVLDVLIIGKDSLYTEGNSNFVYVRTEDDNKERRDITIGESDEHYIEVKSGLSEGEEVYYSSMALMPVKYEPVTVELTDYSIKAKTSKCELADKTVFNLYAREDLKVTQVLVAEGDTVKRGDLVLKVKADGGKADLLAARDAIENEEKAYKQLCKDYKQQIKDLDSRIEEAVRQQEELEKNRKKKDALSEAAEPETEPSPETGGEPQQTDVEEPPATEEQGAENGDERDPEDAVTADMLYQAEQLNCDKEIAILNHKLAVRQHEYTMKQLKDSYNEIKLSNDGQGYRNIYADRDGVVTAVKVEENKKLAAGAAIYTIEQDSKKKLLVTMAAMPGEDEKTVIGRMGAELNQPVQFKLKEQVFGGTCIAKQANAENVYFTEINGIVYASSCFDDASDNWNGNDQFYVAMENESFYDDVKVEEISFDSLIFKDAVVLPASMVYVEQDRISNTMDYYVWRIVDGDLVKQHITISDLVFDPSYVVVLAGVSEGYVLAKEVVQDSEEN